MSTDPTGTPQAVTQTPRTFAAMEWHDCLNKRCGYFVASDICAQLETELHERGEQLVMANGREIDLRAQLTAATQEAEGAKRELGMLRELVGVRADAEACAADAQHWLKMMAKADECDDLRRQLTEADKQRDFDRAEAGKQANHISRLNEELYQSLSEAQSQLKNTVSIFEYRRLRQTFDDALLKFGQDLEAVGNQLTASQAREKKAFVIAERIARHHAKCHKERGLTCGAGSEARTICDLEEQVCTDVANEIARAALANLAPAEAKPEATYPCEICGTLRTKAQGGTTFTVCDECWDKQHKPAMRNPEVLP